jgi:hypothetical protein
VAHNGDFRERGTGDGEGRRERDMFQGSYMV